MCVRFEGGKSLLLTRVIGPVGELLRKLACCARGVGTLRLVFIAVCMSAQVCRGGMGRPTRSTEAGPGASISCVIFFVCCVPSSTHQRAPAACLNAEREDGWLCSSMCSGRSRTRIGSAAGMNSLTPCRDWTAAAHGIPGVAKPAKVGSLPASAVRTAPSRKQAFTPRLYHPGGPDS